ncbi:MAG TPA: rhodanese-like domain-containing protein [Candidatus Polarisedimenticolaceae bacterium]|nr:rhodanese-like domain-containing protein [Candidatus Polarisedimenticolaceae bacterium]
MPDNAVRTLVRDTVVLIAVGLALGSAYNGLQRRGQRGLPWIAEDRMAALAASPTVGAAPPEGSSVAPTSETDPMAIPAAAKSQGLPDIPEIGRPVQIQLAALKQYVDAHAAVVCDAREADEYEQGHVPGAINLPPSSATDPARLEALATGGKPVITYCGGGTCELSMTLAWALFDAGKSRVAVFVGGFPEWVAAGYPVTHGKTP